MADERVGQHRREGNLEGGRGQEGGWEKRELLFLFLPTYPSSL
jgi:hypothetical protein